VPRETLLSMPLIAVRSVCRSEIDSAADDLEQLLDQVEGVSPEMLNCRSWPLYPSPSGNAGEVGRQV